MYTLYTSSTAFYECLITVVIALLHTTAARPKKNFVLPPAFIILKRLLLMLIKQSCVEGEILTLISFFVFLVKWNWSTKKGKGSFQEGVGTFVMTINNWDLPPKLTYFLNL